MLNYYELMNVIDINNHYAIYEINNAFSNDIGEAVKTIKGTAKTREEAFKKYSLGADFSRDSKTPGLYGTHTTVFYNPAITPETIFVNDYSDYFLAMIQNQTPVDVDLQGAAALAKCLGYRAGNSKYVINIGGTIFSWDLVSTIYSMVADIKGVVDHTACYLSDGGDGKYSLKDLRTLIIKSKYATGIILPICYKAPGTIDVSFERYMDFRKDLEARELEAMKKEA